jgi:hypothetical protein
MSTRTKKRSAPLRDLQLDLIAARAGFVRAARRLEERRVELMRAAQYPGAEAARLFTIASNLGPSLSHAIDQMAATPVPPDTPSGGRPGAPPNGGHAPW